MTAIERVGQGYDLHRLGRGRPLIMAGVTLDFPLGLVGHSDGDVVLHAVIDALLGAAGLGDIGEQFPDTDDAYHGADSADLLRRALALVAAQGYAVVNVDLTVLAEQPRLKPYKAAMQRRLADLLAVDAGQVSVKAKTNEGLGPVGQGQAIACYAVAGLSRRPDRPIP